MPSQINQHALATKVVDVCKPTLIQQIKKTTIQKQIEMIFKYEYKIR